MDRYDRLPPVLRAWLAQAVLPWSARSVQRLWPRLLRQASGDVTRALGLLDLAEQRLLRRDGLRIWGAAYPAAPSGSRQSAE